MTEPTTIDGLLVQWGDRYLYPGNRITKTARTPKLRMGSTTERAAFIRERIEALVARRAPQVMVKVTGGGRGMKAIAAHFRYISKHGRLEMEDELGQKAQGKDAAREMADDWRYGGSFIPEHSGRREAFNIILSMPNGTDPLIVQKAAREFAQTELAGHKFVMVLHDHQANPHVHLSVRAESQTGQRLNPRKADLRRWRETFAEKLRGWGIEAEATPRHLRGSRVRSQSIGVIKAQGEGRLRRATAAAMVSRDASFEAKHDRVWAELSTILASSSSAEDSRLRAEVASAVRPMTQGGAQRSAEQRIDPAPGRNSR
jgi:hypothetical protein